MFDVVNRFCDPSSPWTNLILISYSREAASIVYRLKPLQAKVKLNWWIQLEVLKIYLDIGICYIQTSTSLGILELLSKLTHFSWPSYCLDEVLSFAIVFRFTTMKWFTKLRSETRLFMVEKELKSIALDMKSHCAYTTWDRRTFVRLCEITERNAASSEGHFRSLILVHRLAVSLARLI